MRIGILADIHGDVDNLESALARLRHEHVDQIVLLGDVIESRSGASETVSLLKANDAVGVWGNHEMGLSIEPSQAIRDKYNDSVVDFFGTLVPRFELGDLLFSHTLPSEDFTDPASYYLGRRPDEEGGLDPSFAQFPHRVIFIGHFHRWFVATPQALLSWDGSEPLHLTRDQRYLVGVPAVMNGWFAIYDDSTNVMTPCVVG